MTVFFTADLHFGHTNIIEYCNRPFANVDEMNLQLIERWNDTVAVEDTVWVLGDVAMGKIAETLPMVELLNGYKILVPGNHDRCWHGHKKVGRWKERYEEAGFDLIQEGGSMEVAHYDKIFTVCHFPYEGDSHEDDRYENHRPPDEGNVLLHGHVHDKWKVNGRMINVGVDVWDYRPVSFEELSPFFHV